MVIRAISQKSHGEKMVLKKDWVRIEDISPNMIRAVIAAEDNLFVKHNGFDNKAIEQAIEYNKKGKKIRGGSTISQQTAKNVFLWPARSYLRKGLEMYFTFLIEFTWGKKRIMEVYLNVIETGKGMYGVEKASHTYFQKSASSLTASQAALIAALLPSPLRYSVTNPGPYMQLRQAQLVELMPRIETLKIK
jgi:monofunctional biosynthetic peptidoglycan transglycosylase